MALNDATFQVPLPQMLDLALGTPEVGSVNFNILHNFLHILLRQTSLSNTKAEYRGDDAARIKGMVASLKDGSNFYLHESDIVDMDGNIVQRDHIPDRAVVTANFSTIDDQIPQSDSEDREQTWEEGDKEINDNEKDEEKIKSKDPGNDKILGEESKDPGNDKILSEEQIGDTKTSVLASKTSILTTASQAANKISKQSSKKFNCAGQLNDLREEVEFLKDDMAKVKQNVAEMRYHVDQLVVDKEGIAEKAAEKEAVIRDIIDIIEIKSVGHVSSDIPADEVEPFLDEIDVLSVESLPNSEILAEDQSEFSDSRKSSKKPVSTASTLSKLDKDLTNDDKTSKNFDKFEGAEGIQVVQNIKNIEVDIERMNWIIENLNKEKEMRDKNMDILTEQVELLKIMKADREDLEDALASKADATVVNRKVSYHRFDTAYEELTSALEDTILKSSQQETVLREALDTVQQEIDSKLDKTEVFPIQEYMEEKLQALQDKLKELTKKKHDYEAAGAKKILTGLQCITCDRDVIMKREQNALNYPDPMPYRKSIKPYLTYKLDQTRKHQRQFPAKHINQFTAAVQEMNRHKFLTDNIMEKSPRDHFCNRYCGGSHTITTPQQRIMRMGHFLTDWGPEIIQLTEGAVRGTDGQLYHGRPMPPGTTNVPEVCGLDENICCNEKT